VSEEAAGVDAPRALLSPEENERAERLRSPTARRRFVLSRTHLRRVLGSYLGRPPVQLRFVENRYGKPALAGESAESGLGFNVSHSGDIALFAVSLGCAVGVDVEACRPTVPARSLRIADRFFSHEEARALRAWPPAEQSRAFLTCWCRKEAYVKALGRGLSVPLSGFTVEARPGCPPGLLRVEWDAEETRRWQVFDLSPADGYVGAVVAGTGVCRVRCWHTGPLAAGQPDPHSGERA